MKKHIQYFQVLHVRVHEARVALSHRMKKHLGSFHTYTDYSRLMHSLWGGVVGGVGGGATGKVLGWY